MTGAEIALIAICAGLVVLAEIRTWRATPDLRRTQDINVRLMEHVMAMGTTARRDTTQAYCDLLNAAQGLHLPAVMAEQAAKAAVEEGEPPKSMEEQDAEAWAQQQLGLLKASQEILNQQEAEPESSRT